METAPEKLSYKEFLRIAKLISKLYISISPGLVYTHIIARLISYMYPIAMSYIGALLLDRIIDLIKNGGALEETYNYFIWLLVINTLGNLVSGIRGYTYNLVANRAMQHLVVAFSNKLATLGIQSLESPGISNKISRADSSIGSIENYFDRLVTMVASITSFFVSLFLVSINFPVLVPIVLLGTIPNVLWDKKYRVLNWKLHHRTTEGRRKAWSAINNLMNSSKLSEISIVGASEFLKKKFIEFFEEFLSERDYIAKMQILGTRILGTFYFVGYYFGYYLIVKKAFLGQITIGQIAFNVGLLDRLGGDFEDFTALLTATYESSLRFTDFYEIMNSKPIFPNGDVKMKRLEKGPDVSFDQVSFQYPASEKTILENINLDIRSGEKIAIVGHNGAGKTTLVKLLCRIYLPTVGKVKINSTETADLQADYYYRNLAVLFQDYNTYPTLSVLENVSIGKPLKEIDTELVIEALKKADAWSFVSEYPNGLNQILSENYEGGIRPSTGQWQKIAIARFFYRNAPFVIFDEPTAAIDAISEYNIFNKIYEFFEGKTVIIISHRFSTVRNADRIIVMENGHIIEQGSHDELIKLDGYYAKSFKLQAEGYANLPVETII